MAVRGTASDNPAKWELSHRYLAGQVDRATHRTVLMRHLTRSFKAGVEVNELVGEIGFVANWRALSETKTSPALILGTSSDRIGTPAGQSYYITASKSLHRELGLPIAPYAGLSYSGHRNRVIYPFGVNVAITPRWTALVMNDGAHTHLSTTWSTRGVALTLLAVRLKDFGISIGTSF